MSDQLILGLATAVVGTVGTAFASWMAFKMAALKVAQDAAKVEIVETKAIAVATHEKVNSMSLILARRLATATEKLAVADATAENIEGAVDAAKALNLAEQVQSDVDQKK